MVSNSALMPPVITAKVLSDIFSFMDTICNNEKQNPRSFSFLMSEKVAKNTFS